MERYPRKSHNPILSTGILYGVLIFLAISACGCTGRPSRVVNRPLTAEEMAIPPGRYQHGIDMRHTCQVDLDSPQNEPVFRWVVKPDVTVDSTDVMVDGEGGVWYNDGPSGGMSLNAVIRLNPDGSEDFRKRLLPSGHSDDFDLEAKTYTRHSSFSTVRPVVALDGAIIWHANRLQSSAEYENLELISEDYTIFGFLECIDTEGETRWRTEPSEVSPLFNNSSFRV